MMTDDERAIRELIDTWLAASKAGDTNTVLSLMTDDVVFMVAGQKPFGKTSFMAASETQKKSVSSDGKSDILELQVLGDWAFLRQYLEVTIAPKDGSSPMQFAGNTLTILRKETDGRWLLARDANLLMPRSS